MTNAARELRITLGAMLILLFFGMGFTWVRSSMEASAYNRITGSDVTTWEAVWVQLRVDCR